MSKNILCRVGKHHWALRANDDGEPYRECVHCAAVKNDPPPPDFGSTAIVHGGGGG